MHETIISVTGGEGTGGQLLAISDLHVGYAENRQVVEGLHPTSADDWLLVAGDIAETVADVQWVLGKLADRFHTVVWAPGNHELWTARHDPVTLRGEARYRHLVEVARSLGVVTPEDPYRVWTGPGGPATVVPLFLLYDYTFLPDGCATKEEGLAYAHSTGIVCNDEFMLHFDPYPSREAWCAARISSTVDQLAARDESLPTVLVNHYPLVRDPTFVLRYPEFAQWCGTVRTADWHLRYNATAVVYGHLHIPRTTWYDGVRFEEVSLGYPREWIPRKRPVGYRVILPAPPA